jgi:hypothetical protein
VDVRAVEELPTAQAFVGPVTAIEVRLLSVPALGLGTIFQAVPFQRSIKVLSWPPSWYEPTTQALQDGTTATAARSLNVAPGFAGCGADPQI